MLMTLVAAVVGIGSGVSRCRWQILALFSAGIIVSAAGGIAHMNSLIAAPLCVIMSEVVKWAEASSSEKRV